MHILYYDTLLTIKLYVGAYGWIYCVLCFSIMIEYILLGVIAVAVYLAISSDPPPIAGYYHQPGKFYYLKVGLNPSSLSPLSLSSELLCSSIFNYFNHIICCYVFQPRMKTQTHYYLLIAASMIPLQHTDLMAQSCLIYKYSTNSFAISYFLSM